MQAVKILKGTPTLVDLLSDILVDIHPEGVSPEILSKLKQALLMARQIDLVQADVVEELSNIEKDALVGQAKVDRLAFHLRAVLRLFDRYALVPPEVNEAKQALREVAP